MTITDKSIHYINTALNRYLALDPESHQRLQTVQNKKVMIEFCISHAPLFREKKNTFQLLFTTQGVQLKTNHFSESDAYIKGTPLSLLHMVLVDEKKRKTFFAEGVSIEGDLDVAQHVIELFDKLDIDWEEYASHWIGDIPAHQLGRFTRKARTFGSRLRETLAQNINEYVHEEIDLFPAPEALNDFYNDVDMLRMDTDRLEARIQRLKTTREQA